MKFLSKFKKKNLHQLEELCLFSKGFEFVHADNILGKLDTFKIKMKAEPGAQQEKSAPD